MLEITLIIIIVSCLILYIFYQKNSTIPGPWGLPIIGYLHKLDPEAPYLTLTKLAQKYGPIYSIKLGMMDTVVISDATLVRKVLLKDESLGRPRLFLLDFVFQRKGIAYNEGDSWKELRKFLGNFLRTSGAMKTSANKKTLEEEINNNFEEFVQAVKKRGSNVTINALEEILSYTSRIAAALFLGKSVKDDEKTFNILTHDVREIIKLAAVGGPLNFLPFLRFLPSFGNTMRSITKLFKNVHRIQNDIINETLKSCPEDENSAKNMIHAFLLQKSKSTSEEIYNFDQLEYLSFDLYAASVETTVTTIVWTIKYLAAYPEVQEKVRQEISSALKGRKPNFDDLVNLSYTKATIFEVSRIRSVVPLGFPHCALEDIHVGNIKIPKGTMIMPLIWSIHMNPKLWKNPEEFCPDRFLDADGKFCTNDSSMPFLIGKRICPGEDLAKMLIFLFFATVLQHFRIENSNSSSDFSGICGITLVPKQKEAVFVQI